MRVPHHLLRQNVSIEDYDGSGAAGPVYSAARSVRASVQPTERLLEDYDGQEMVIQLRVTIRPEDGPVSVDSKVTYNSTTYRVARSYPYPDERRPYSYDLMLTQYAS